MNIVIRRDSLKNMLFYIPYVAYLLYSLLNTSFYAKYINSYGKILFAFCILLLLLKEFLGARFTSRDGVLALVLIVITGYFYMYFGLTQTLLPIFIYSARNMEVNKILRISYVISVFMLVFIILSSYLGIIQNYIYYSALRERQYLGFRYALYPSSILCNIIFLKVYLEKENISWLSLICLLVANYVLFQYTDSRLTFILGVALIVFSTIMKKSQKFREILLNRTFIWSFLVLALLSIYATINYDYLSDWQSDLNEALGGRLSLGNSTLKFYGYGLFGKTLSLSGNGLDENGMLNTSTYDYVDNLYVLLLLRAGIIFLFIFLVAMTIIMKKIYIQKDSYLYIIFILLAFHGIIDDLIMLPRYNSCSFVVAALFMGRKISKTTNIENTE